MIYITGDTHGYYDQFIARFNGVLPSQNDIVIVCGDFGFIFSDRQQEDFDKLKGFPCSILFVDGNHENFPKIFSYLEEEWCGGKIHRIAPNIIHLMRGQLFTINEKTFFTMGGAYSIDRGWRIRGKSWFEEELPSNEEYKTASATLEKCGYKVDYILTHEAPESAIMRMGITPNPRGAELAGYLEWLKRTADFKMWFFGHYHTECTIEDKLVCLYENVVTLD